MTAEHDFLKRLPSVLTSENEYLTLLARIMRDGVDKSDRTGTGIRSLFAPQLRFDLAAGFPLLTTKRVHIKSVIHELLWFIKGDTNVAYLREHGVKIWDAWADEHGNLGPVYGRQWRNWGGLAGVIIAREELDEGTIAGLKDFALASRQSFLVIQHDAKIEVRAGIDQLVNVIERIKTNPDCRRLIVSAWNVADLPEMALAPCHVMFQFYVANSRLSCHLYQRSADMFLGVPFNIASYALLTQMVAHVTGLALGELVISFGDAHIYSNHFEQVREQLGREPRSLPVMQVRRQVETIDDFKFEDFDLIGYDPHPAIKAPVSV